MIITGLEIRVSWLPEVSNICNQVLREVWKNSALSLAHVIMPAGGISLLHEHHTFTELYYILSGRGILTLGSKELQVREETLVVIPPRTPHRLKNVGKSRLRHLVISNPPFNPQDVILLEEMK